MSYLGNYLIDGDLGNHPMSPKYHKELTIKYDDCLDCGKEHEIEAMFEDGSDYVCVHCYRMRSFWDNIDIELLDQIRYERSNTKDH